MKLLQDHEVMNICFYLRHEDITVAGVTTREESGASVISNVLAVTIWEGDGSRKLLIVSPEIRNREGITVSSCRVFTPIFGSDWWILLRKYLHSTGFITEDEFAVFDGQRQP